LQDSEVVLATTFMHFGPWVNTDVRVKAQMRARSLMGTSLLETIGDEL